MVKAVRDLDDEVNNNSRRAIQMFYEKCDKLNLTKTSIAQLLGVSRQTLGNYQDGTVPSRGVIVRLKLVYPLIQKAIDAELLPVGARREQGALVETILHL